MDFFILGNPRSGTTLLRLMLNSHSLIGVPPESGFLQWWYKKYNNWTLIDTLNNSTLDDFLTDILNSKKIEDWNLNKNELKIFIVNNLPKNYIEMIDYIYKYYTKSKPIIGDKNNYYINYLSEIKLISPQAKYIHIARDGRDVACSYKTIHKLNQKLKYIPKVPSKIEEIACEWNQNITIIENFISNHNNKGITIRYEDLISKPKAILQKICSFLNVEFEDTMLNYYKTSNYDEPASTIHWKKKTLQPIDINNKKKYLQLLSKKEITIFNKIAIHNLKRLNYEQ